MKLLLGVVLIALVASSSAFPNRRRNQGFGGRPHGGGGFGNPYGGGGYGNPYGGGGGFGGSGK